MKRKIFLAGILTVCLVAVFILWIYFSRGEVKKFEFQNKNISENIDTENNIAENSSEAATDNSPTENNTPEEINKNNDNPVSSSDKTAGKKPDNYANIINRLVSWGYQKADKRLIDTIIIHSSYNALGGDVYDIDKLLAEYKSYGVAPHYVISREGKIYQLVSDKNIAYHAGESKTPDGRTAVNNFSIGIEVVTTQSEKPTDEQYQSLKKLLTILDGRYKIKYILGHSDIAKGRKDDPWNFEWGKIK